MSTCKLCGEKKDLLKQSHIIPRFMYNDMLDDNHPLKIGPLKQGIIENYQIKNSLIGEYEGGLLCAECDNILLGYYENYASRVFYGGELLETECPAFQDVINQNGIGLIKCTNLNYHKFKLFLLSVLWRANISTRPFFSKIKLEQEQAEDIRKMLLKKDAGETFEYPIIVYAYTNNPDLSEHIIEEPIKIKTKEGLISYSFIINGYIYHFYINNTSVRFPDFIIPK